MNNRFDRTLINVRERPLSSDINTAQSQLDRSLREVLKSVFTGRVGSGTSDLSGNPPSGFLGDGFKARARGLGDMSVVLAKGNGFQYLPADVPSPVVGAPGGTDDLCEFKPLALLADAVIAGVAAGDAANPRIDIIEVRMNRVVGNPLSRDVLDVGTGAFVATSVNKTLSFTQDGSVGVVVDPAISTAAVSYKQGIPGAVPVEPAVTPGYVRVTTLKIPATITTILKAHIIDQRPLLAADGLQQFTASLSLPFAAAAPTACVFRGPAGLEMVIWRPNATATNVRFKVFIIGGALPLGGTISAQAIKAFGGQEFVFVQQASGTIVGALTGGEVTDLSSGTRATPALTWPVGTPYIAAEFTAYHQNAGTTNNVVTDPLVFEISGTIQRY